MVKEKAKKDLKDFPYRDGKLLNPVVPNDTKRFGYLGTDIPIECNEKCTCQQRKYRKKNPCTNHVVQDGLKVKLEMFLTEKKGWGIRARQNIPKGTFMGVYIGEIRQNEENPGHNKARKFTSRYKSNR